MTNFVSTLVAELRLVLKPLARTVTDPGVRKALGARLGANPDFYSATGVAEAFAAARDAALALESVGSLPASLAAVRDGFAAVRNALQAARQIGASSTVDPHLGIDLLRHVVLTYARLRAPIAYLGAEAVGIATVTALPWRYDGAVVIREPVPVSRVDVERLVAFLRNPLTAIRTQLPAEPLATTAAAHETADLAVNRMAPLLHALAIPWRYGYAPEDEDLLGETAAYVEHALMFYIPESIVGEAVRAGVSVALSAADDADLGILVSPFGSLTVGRDLERWRFEATATDGIDLIAFGGGEGLQILSAVAATEARATAELIRAPAGEAWVIGATAGTRLELEGVRFHGAAALSAAQRTVHFGFEVERGLFVVTSDGGDGFLGRVLGDRELRAELDFGVAYTSGRGLRFKGGAGLAVRIPAGGTLGPLTLDEVSIALEVSAEALRLVMSCGVQVKLGPVLVRVDGVGTQLVAVLPSASPTRDFDLDFDFKPPDGAGFAIEAGPVRGGGYLSHVTGRYTGALALEAMGLSFSAIGILDTHVAGGGYSLAAVVCAEFHRIQIGMGFTLDGVGGLIGIHRRVDTDALRATLAGPESGITDIFFAADPIAQAARLTGDLARYFPAAEGRYVVGPAVKLGWGTPTMVRGVIAILLELPSPLRVVLLGTVSAALPTQDHPVVDLHIDVVGELDLGEKRLAIDASLRDSTIAGFPIRGDLAFRMRWGDEPSFALAIGGFHSQFRAPPDFPTLRRIEIPIGDGDDPRFDVQGFLALTSNTAQIGAQAELYASAGPLNIRGSLGFETLIVFSPFSLQVDVWAGVKLRRGNSTLAGIHFDGHIKGPGPWRVDGKATLSLWFVDLSVAVHVSFGRGQPVELPSRDIWPLLLAELERPESWSTNLPPGLHAVTTAPPPGEPATVRLDPCAAVTFRQKIVPLGRTITRFAQSAPAGVSRFNVSEVRLGGQLEASAPVADWFAPAQFEELSDADKLSRPGFERMTAGFTIGGEVRAPVGLTKPLTYETVLWAGPARQTGAAYEPSHEAQVVGTAVSSSAQAPFRCRGAAAYAPTTPPVFTLKEETYVIASTATLQARTDLIDPGTRGDAELALRAHLTVAPHEAFALQVVPAHEAVA